MHRVHTTNGNPWRLLQSLSVKQFALEGLTWYDLHAVLTSLGAIMKTIISREEFVDQWPLLTHWDLVTPYGKMWKCRQQKYRPFLFRPKCVQSFQRGHPSWFQNNPCSVHPSIKADEWPVSARERLVTWYTSRLVKLASVQIYWHRGVFHRTVGDFWCV